MNTSTIAADTNPTHLLPPISGAAPQRHRPISDLRQLVSPRLARAGADRRRLDLRDLIFQAACGVLGSPIFAAKRLEMALDIQAEGHSVWGDPSRLGSVLRSMLTAVARQSPAGGKVAIRLRSIATQPGDAADGAARGELVVEVKGAREGAAGARRERSVLSQFGRLGFWLALGRGVVEQHGGSLTYRQEADAATTFDLRLPQT